MEVVSDYIRKGAAEKREWAEYQGKQVGGMEMQRNRNG